LVHITKTNNIIIIILNVLFFCQCLYVGMVFLPGEDISDDLVQRAVNLNTNAAVQFEYDAAFEATVSPLQKAASASRF